MTHRAEVKVRASGWSGPELDVGPGLVPPFDRLQLGPPRANRIITLNDQNSYLVPFSLTNKTV